MAAPFQSLLGHIHRLARRGPGGALTDAELLRRYCTDRDEAAFEALLWRHAAMVLGVCRRTLRGEADAEDAFQATFLAFARSAGSVRRSESVGGWLHRVAHRVARKARARAARRAGVPLPELAQCGADPAAQAVGRDLRSCLDEEIGRLPAHERTPFVLCYIQGRTNAEAARELGLAPGTIATRLAAARQRLRARLGRRGLALTAGLACLSAGQAASARPAPAQLVRTTTRAAHAFAHGTASEAVSAPVLRLARGVLRELWLTRCGAAAAALAAVGLIVLAVATAACQAPADPPQTLPAPAAAQAAGAPKVPAAPTGPAGGRLLFYRQGHLTLLGPDGKNEKRVSQDRGKFMPGLSRLSPDGTRIAFLVQVEEHSPPGRDPRRKVYVRGLHEPEPGKDLEVEAQTLSWSADGKQLAVTDLLQSGPKTFQCTSWLVDIKTGRKSALAVPENQFITDWSPDGQSFLTTEYDPTGDEPVSRLHLVRRDGSADRRLASGDAAEGGRLSPDGTRVLYEAPDPQRAGQKTDDRWGLFVLDVRTGKSARVDGQPLNATLMGYCWSPDGRRIAYAWRQNDAPEGQPTESHLVVADADGRNPVTLASEWSEFSGTITISEPDWR